MSLTTTSKAFRKGIKILGVFAFIYYLMILFIIPNVRDAILNAFVDRDPPNPKYGVLDSLKFISVPLKNQNPKYVLDTKDGRLPAGFPKKMKVYSIKPAQYSYLAGKNAQKDASILGFDERDLISDLKSNQYQWQSQVSGGLLSIDTENRSILLLTDLRGRTKEYKTGRIDVESAKDNAVVLLRSLDRYNEELYNKDNFKVIFGQIIGSSIVETKVVAQAQFARVDINGKVDEYTIYGPDAQTGTITLVLRTPEGEKPAYNYPIFTGYFWNVDKNTDATYPIISVAEAWKQVQSGKGIISSVTPKNYNPFGAAPEITADQILIKRIYLAYYSTPEYQKHLQPIYVFEGSYVNGNDGGTIYIYYPAVTAQYSKVAEPSTNQPNQQ